MKIGVIGAGAAGLIAGAFAAKGGARVDIIDRNEKTGKKTLSYGKGQVQHHQFCRYRCISEKRAA